MKLRFFVIAYGDRHLDLLDRIAVRSLTQPKNKEAIPEGAVVALYSDAASIDRATEIASRLATVEPHVVELKPNHYDTQNDIFIEEVGRCVREDAAMVIVNPDCFWGDGSLGNLLFIAGDQNVCVASPHVRVDKAAFLASLGEDTLTNPRLVSLAMRTLHQSWIDADTTKDDANSYFTGIGLRAAWPLHVVHHLQPTIFFARLTARDYGFFAERKGQTGLWDHVWPSVIVAEGRQRTVAASDAIFIAELTDTETHTTPLQKLDRTKPDAFCRDAPHIAVNRGVVAIWREGA